MRVLLGCLLVLACLSLVASVNCPGPTTAGLECIDLANLCNFLDDGTGVLVAGATDYDDGCGDVSFPQGLDLFGTMYTSLGVFSNGFVRPSCAGAVDFEIDIAHKDVDYSSFGGTNDLNPLTSGDVHVGVTTGDSTPLGLVTYDGVYEYYYYFSFSSQGTTTAQLIMPQVPDFVILHTVSTTIGRARHSVFDGVEDLEDGSGDFSGDCMAFLIPSSVQAYIDGGGDLDFLDRAVDGGFNSAPFQAKLSFPGACCFCDSTCSVLSSTDCGTASGTYQGDGTTCSVSCPCESAAPTVTAPADATVECDADSSPASTGTATANDNCDSSPVTSFTDSLSIGRCTGTSTLTRSWVATDACGNISPVDDQTITVNNRGHVASVEVVEGCSASSLSDAHLICTLKDIEVRVELPGSDCICELDPVDFETRNAVVTSVKSVGARRAISTAFVVSIEVRCDGFFSVSLSSEVLLEGNFVGNCLLGLVR